MGPDEPTILLTGATGGIGLATARSLATSGGTLVLHGPEDRQSVEPMLDDLARARPAGSTTLYLAADFGRLDEVRALARQVTQAVGRLDVLINNAARAGPERRSVTVDGHEVTLQTNYLAPFTLTWLLRPLLVGNHRARIVNVASATHLSADLPLDDLELARHPYTPVGAYARSKLALVVWTCALAADLAGSRCEAVSIHPGIIATPLLSELFHMSGDPPEHAAANIVALVRSPNLWNGKYVDERREAAPNPIALDVAFQRLLLHVTMEMAGLSGR